MTTKARTKHQGITKITYTSGDTRYRLIITVGKRPDNREIQECHTFRTMTEALKKQAEIRDARDKGKFVKRDSVTFDVLCQRWLDSRHDVREVTVMGYRSWLMAVREQLGPKRVQDLTRTDIEKVIKRLEQQNRSHSTIVHTLRCYSASPRLRDQLQPALRQRRGIGQASPEAAQHCSR
jgi:hypothetical protein